MEDEEGSPGGLEEEEFFHGEQSGRSGGIAPHILPATWHLSELHDWAGTAQKLWVAHEVLAELHTMVPWHVLCEANAWPAQE